MYLKYDALYIEPTNLSKEFSAISKNGLRNQQQNSLGSNFQFKDLERQAQQILFQPYPLDVLELNE